ncbi:MAG: homoserine dehydrogenase [Proteobacteria bacterium]|nr:homoserine dehydrogenase [Pseudomonadota bacterium]
MSTPLRVGIAGLGTVGATTFQLLSEHAALVAARAGRPIQVAAVSARDRTRNRGIDLSESRWYDAPKALTEDPEIDAVVELIGGADGIAQELCEQAIAHGKHVVTANKALIAHHGTALATAAEAAGVALGFEAAVAGGIPIVKALREGLAANAIQRVYGILNGTCNYILSAMDHAVSEGKESDFAATLAEAQRLGYAEADPSFDVDGIDTAHKLAILTGLAFGCPLDFAAVHIEGIRAINGVDIGFARELGYKIKLLGIAGLTEGGVEQRVHPSMVPLANPIAHVDGVFNAVVAHGDHVDRALFEGRGAGGGPTASAVVADLIDIARGLRPPSFSIPAAELSRLATVPIEKRRGAYYIRLMVLDRPGVIADVTACLRDHQVSMEAMLQRARAPGEAVPVVMTTHETVEASMRHALTQIAALDSVLEPPHMIRIEHL